ncbi:MAG: cryptochrome/photolyase family protein, partial [Candidatus Omnitrophica bacterium]|nr:cryptochrome/photolyase family protein [Candidatus Omnitrophota bacterium]
QLDHHGALPRALDPKTNPVCLIESVPSLTRHRFHKKRLVLVLSMVRHFAEELRARGFTVFHYQLDQPESAELCEAGEEACLRDFVARSGIARLRAMEAAEYDAQMLLLSVVAGMETPIEVIQNDQFLIHRETFSDWFDSIPDPSMESFYRKRRRETGMLMQEDQPLGGRWNFDGDNRVPPTGNMPIPGSLVFEPDSITRRVIETVERRFPDHFGDTEEFSLPVTREQVLAWLAEFLSQRLRLFGMYQDAMLAKSNRMYHSFLSPYLNHGLLRSAEVLKAVEEAYQNGDAPLNSTEGFIRQVLGWREYLHGFYWMKMPEYREINFFDCHRSIPQLMKDGDTNLKCLKCVIDQSRRDAYAHHIQRLMVIGNFALLIGVEPKAMVRWMMEMYIDAAEWAAVPNVMGMTLYADGGEVGSKPYAASAHYIDKMSDYCHGCHYRERKRVGEKACPLNYLYWNFVGVHQDQLKGNPRMQTAIQMYRHKSPAERKLIETSSQQFLEQLDATGTDRRLKKPARAAR